MICKRCNKYFDTSKGLFCPLCGLDHSRYANHLPQTIYFNHGKMYKVENGDPDEWYDARYLVSDGQRYDLERFEDIVRIPVPKFGTPDAFEGYGVTGSLDYVIRMKAGRLRDKGLIRESDACYRKSTILMKASGIGYDIKPYLYLAKELLREGRFEESELEEKRISELLDMDATDTFEGYNQIDGCLQTCSFLNIDHVEIRYETGTCDTCSIYHGRVYSLSGRDKRFPKFPQFILEQKCIHPDCRHQISPYFDAGWHSTIEYRGKTHNAIIVSNRPFKVDVNDIERQQYQSYLEYMDKNYRPYITQEDREYYRIKYLLPDLAPKSINGYTRMKRTRSANFLKIYQAAKDIGIDIIFE